MRTQSSKLPNALEPRFSCRLLPGARSASDHDAPRAAVAGAGGRDHSALLAREFGPGRRARECADRSARLAGRALGSVRPGPAPWNAARGVGRIDALAEVLQPEREIVGVE